MTTADGVIPAGPRSPPCSSPVTPFSPDNLRALDVSPFDELDPEVSPLGAAEAWAAAHLVLVDAEVLILVAAFPKTFPQRDRVIVVTDDVFPQDLWKFANRIGATYIVEIPAAADWLADKLRHSLATPARSLVEAARRVVEEWGDVAGDLAGAVRELAAVLNDLGEDQ